MQVKHQRELAKATTSERHHGDDNEHDNEQAASARKVSERVTSGQEKAQLFHSPTRKRHHISELSFLT